MFNIGPGELIVVALVVLIAVGPEQLPGVIRKVGQTVAQLRSMTEGLRTEFMAGLEEIERAADVQTWADDPRDDPEPKTRPRPAGDPEPVAAVPADDGEETTPDPAAELEEDDEPEPGSPSAERLDRGPQPSSNGSNGDGGADPGLPREEPPTAEERA